MANEKFGNKYLSLERLAVALIKDKTKSPWSVASIMQMIVADLGLFFVKPSPKKYQQGKHPSLTLPKLVALPLPEYCVQNFAFVRKMIHFDFLMR